MSTVGRGAGEEEKIDVSAKLNFCISSGSRRAYVRKCLVLEQAGARGTKITASSTVQIDVVSELSFTPWA